MSEASVLSTVWLALQCSISVATRWILRETHVLTDSCCPADDLKPILEKRDPASCELHLWRSAWARGPKKHGMFRLCPRTELPYGECCGALRRHH